MAYSARLEKNIGIDLVSNEVADDVDNLQVSAGNEMRLATTNSLPFIS